MIVPVCLLGFRFVANRNTPIDAYLVFCVENGYKVKS